jgi:beta-N-acetylhexosaminidase
MTAHVVFEPLDPRRPATLSRPVIDLLRQDCGYDGCVVSDDLEMSAVAKHFPLEEAVPAALDAGLDALMVCHRADVAHRAIDLARRAVEEGAVPRARLAEARRRVEALVAWAGPPPDPRAARALLRTGEHLALAARIPSLAVGRDPPAA